MIVAFLILGAVAAMSLLVALLVFAVRKADGRIDHLTQYRRDNRAAGRLRDKTCPPW